LTELINSVYYLSAAGSFSPLHEPPLHVTLPSGTNLKRGRAYNIRVVLEAIRLYAPIARTDIARRTALSAQAISKIVTHLMEDGFLVEVGKRQNGPGPPSINLDINANRAYAVGIDVGRDHLTAVLANLKGEVAESRHVEVEYPAPKQALAWMGETVDDLVAAAGISRDRLCGAGVGVPGPLDTAEDEGGGVRVVNPESFPGWSNVPIADQLSERLGLPAFLENNATAAAIGERWYGEGQHVPHFFYVFFGVGLGGGLVVDGQPYAGHSGNAGELGYALPDAGDDPAGGSYYLPHIYERLQEEGLDVHSPADLASVFDEGHPGLENWLNGVASAVAPKVAAVEALFDPEAIFFGGRLPITITEHLVQELAAPLARLRASQKDHEPALRIGTVGRHTAALGVATIPLYDAFSPTSPAPNPS